MQVIFCKILLRTQIFVYPNNPRRRYILYTRSRLSGDTLTEEAGGIFKSSVLTVICCCSLQPACTQAGLVLHTHRSLITLINCLAPDHTLPSAEPYASFRKPVTI